MMGLYQDFMVKVELLLQNQTENQGNVCRCDLGRRSCTLH